MQVGKSEKRLLVLPENGSHLKAELPPAFQLPLARLQDHTRIVLQLLGEIHVRAFAGESRKTHAVLATVACRFFRELGSLLITSVTKRSIDLAAFVLTHFCSGARLRLHVQSVMPDASFLHRYFLYDMPRDRQRISFHRTLLVGYGDEIPNRP